MPLIALAAATLLTSAHSAAPAPVEFPDIPATSEAIDAEIVRLGWAFPPDDAGAAARWEAYAGLMTELETALDDIRELLDDGDTILTFDLRQASIGDPAEYHPQGYEALRANAKAFVHAYRESEIRERLHAVLAEGEVSMPTEVARGRAVMEPDDLAWGEQQAHTLELEILQMMIVGEFLGDVRTQAEVVARLQRDADFHLRSAWISFSGSLSYADLCGSLTPEQRGRARIALRALRGESANEYGAYAHREHLWLIHQGFKAEIVVTARDVQMLREWLRACIDIHHAGTTEEYDRASARVQAADEAGAESIPFGMLAGHISTIPTFAAILSIAPLEIQLALSEYKHRHDALPQTLEELVTEGLLDAVPTDPSFPGTPFDYAIDDNAPTGYTLTSRGPAGSAREEHNLREAGRMRIGNDKPGPAPAMP